ncbi:hypothetical protein CAP31_12445 [Sulfuriferula sp. AH1]|uniref:SdrD B-like domain-containing protein n=1 Tax=Sulfuriferula sp. AH1 TaxID=1985873 RepID=UPI000B3B3E5A|nr:SdrD B-like domain-containing protein [Sulfuriferula sp. AH1]ARU32415.1 hypothetical protein CAP31_12445 [Sulfuriferula sp. AH1]
MPIPFALFHMLLACVLFITASSVWAAPLAGSLIENQATASYRDDATGLYSRATSNTVRIVVQAVEGVTLAADRDTVRAPGSGFELAHRLTNTGNTPTHYRLEFGNLTDNAFNAAHLKLVRDLNGNGQAESGEPEVAAGGTLLLELGQSADLVLTGTVSSAAMQGNVTGVYLQATGTTQGVSAKNTDRITVANGAVLVLAKRASDLTPQRGEEVMFTITATNQGNLPAGSMPITVDGIPKRYVVLRDRVPVNTVLRDVVGSGQGVALYHRQGDPRDAYFSRPPEDAVTDAVAWGLPALAPGQTAELRMTVQINDNAHERISNTAEADYDGRPAAATSNTVVLTLPNQPAALAAFADAGFSTQSAAVALGAPLYLQADLASCNRTSQTSETVSIIVTAARTGDSETFVAEETETNSGMFRVSFGVPTRDAATYVPVSGNGVLEVRRDDSLLVRVAGCNDEVLESTVLIDPFGVLFDSRTNVPVTGATVRLIDVTGDGNGGNAGGPARVFLADGVTPAPSTVVTAADGRYAFPLVAQSTYRLDITPPTGFGFPSQLPPALLPPGRVIQISGSYGGNFPVNLATGAVNIDVPIDDISGDGLLVEKTVSRSVAEIAEFVDYTVRVKNVSGSALFGVTLNDSLPRGFRYERGSARLDKSAIADPSGGVGPALAFSLGTLNDGAEVRLSYRVKIGPGAREGDGINRAQAVSAAPFSKTSNVAAAKVRVEGGVFDDRGFVLGKVFADCNGNGVPDAGEPGIPGVRLYLENGDFVSTDAAGRYNFYGLTPRTHVLKADRASLPFGAKLAETSQRNAGDAGSLFVDLKTGELHRADFAVAGCTPEVLTAIRLRMPQDKTAIKKLADVVTRPAALPDLTGLLAGLDAAPGFLYPADGIVLLAPQVKVRVKGAAGGRLTLWVNGVVVPSERVGTRVMDKVRGVQATEYVGVPLVPGINTLELVQEDDFGNRRGAAGIQLTVPGELARLEWEMPAAGIPADGRGPALLRLKLLDAQGVPVSARTPVTLQASAGRWLVADLNPAEAGVQTFIEGGVAVLRLVPPDTPRSGMLYAISGKTQTEARIAFVPALRDMLAVGVVEGAINLRRLSAGAVEPAGPGDGFEREIAHFAVGSAERQVSARTALFLKGKVKGDYLLTLAYDSDKETGTGLFRDIQPDRYYPVYGDDSAKGFDARSSGRLFLRVDKGKSFLLYGDFATAGATPARSLAAYKRSLTGVRYHLEQENFTVDSFASNDRSRRVVQEFPGNGTSGPYLLGTSDVVIGSDQVELITRDGNQPSVVLQSTPQVRFVDYDIEPFSGRILFRQPVPSTDANLNPVFVRVTYETEQGGEAFWTTGVAVKARVSESAEIGISRTDDRNPQSPYALTGINATLQLAEKTRLIAEVATSDRAGETGQGRRVELTHDGGDFKARIWGGRTDASFDNPSASLSRGRGESGAKLGYRLDEKTSLRAEAIHTEDVATGGSRDGIRASVERVLIPGVRLETGLRHARETTTPAQPGSVGGLNLTTARVKLSAQLPDYPQATVYGEAEQSIQGRGGLLGVGGEYRLAGRGRLYARHEFVNSLNGAYGLNDNQRQNVTVIGLDADYMQDGRTFSEYRARNAFSGRETEAAIGLRNRWGIAEGVRLDTSFERVASISGSGKGESLAATGAVEYTLRPDMKGTARLELRSGEASNAVLTTLGIAYKLSDGWAFLGKHVLNLVHGKSAGAADQTRSRLQLGLAWRDVEDGRLNGLARYEHKFEEDDSTNGFRRTVHIFSTHANYQANRRLTLSGRYAGKLASETSNGLDSRAIAHLLSGRLTHELSDKWDMGLGAGVLVNGDFGSRRYSAGAEVGYLLAKNLWASVGYNVRGFSDRDLTASDYTERGVYMRLRFKFDEALLAGIFDNHPGE